MPTTPRRMRRNAGPDLRARLRARLVKIRDTLNAIPEESEENGWPYEHTTAARMADAYGLDRIDAIDRGDPVRVVLYEVLSQYDRQGFDPLTFATLHLDGRLIFPTSVGEVPVGGRD